MIFQAEAAVEVQKILNEKAGIGIKAIKPEMNEDRVRGIINVVSRRKIRGCRVRALERRS